MPPHPSCFFFFFFNDTATTEIYTLSLHDALPISSGGIHADHSGAADSCRRIAARGERRFRAERDLGRRQGFLGRSEEHTSELQSRLHLVCRLLLEKKKTQRHPRSLPSTTNSCRMF